MSSLPSSCNRCIYLNKNDPRVFSRSIEIFNVEKNDDSALFCRSMIPFYLKSFLQKLFLRLFSNADKFSR